MSEENEQAEPAAGEQVSTEQVATEQTGQKTNEQLVAEAVNGEQETPTWSYNEGIAGEGEPPEWFKADKYKTVSEQAKAYTELESKFGSFTGAPEDYALELSESLQEQGVQIDDDDPILAEAKEFAKNSNMSQKGFNEMVELYSITKIAEAQALEQSKQDEIKALGNNAQTRLNNLSAWASANLSEDLVEGFQQMTATAASVKALEHMIGLTRSAPLSSADLQSAGGVTEEEVKSMLFAKDEFGNRKINTDPSFKAEYEKKRDALWGSGEHRVVVGG